jgi:hypothetical protein
MCHLALPRGRGSEQQPAVSSTSLARRQDRLNVSNRPDVDPKPTSARSPASVDGRPADSWRSAAGVTRISGQAKLRVVAASFG